jgi:hypothetical protein
MQAGFTAIMYFGDFSRVSSKQRNFVTYLFYFQISRMSSWKKENAIHGRLWTDAGTPGGDER